MSKVCVHPDDPEEHALVLTFSRKSLGPIFTAVPLQLFVPGKDGGGHWVHNVVPDIFCSVVADAVQQLKGTRVKNSNLIWASMGNDSVCMPFHTERDLLTCSHYWSVFFIYLFHEDVIRRVANMPHMPEFCDGSKRWATERRKSVKIETIYYHARIQTTQISGRHDG